MGEQIQAKPKKTERVRGEHLRVLVKRSEGVAFKRALELVEDARGVIASNKRMDNALQTSEWKQVSEGLWCWTGTLTAYAKPDEKFTGTVEYTDSETNERWVFRVPKEHQGKRNGVLVAEHPDYTVERDGNNLVVHPKEGAVSLVERFPKEDGWHLTDSEHGIPIGNLVSSENADARYLWRINSRVGPVARGYDDVGDYRRRDVDLDDGPSGGCGVVTEATAGGAPQVQASAENLISVADPKTLRKDAEQLKQLADNLSKRFGDDPQAQEQIIQPMLEKAARFVEVAEAIERGMQ